MKDIIITYTFQVNVGKEESFRITIDAGRPVITPPALIEHIISSRDWVLLPIEKNQAAHSPSS